MKRICSIIFVMLVIPASSQAAYKPFTLNQAKTLATQYESGLGTVSACHWVKLNVKAECSVLTPVETILNNLGPAQLEWTDAIYRSGPCPTPVTSRTGPHRGIASGTDDKHKNCPVGPLTIAPIRSTLQVVPII